MNILGVDLSKRVCIVAEIGNQAEGDIGMACTLIGIAKDAGCDAAKFQLASTPPEGSTAPTWFNKEEFHALTRFGQMIDMPVFASVFDHEALDWVENYPAVKLSWGLRGRLDLLVEMQRRKRPIIVSCNTGLYHECDVLLHVVNNYPCASPELGEVSRLVSELSMGDEGPKASHIGYSDHCIGIEAAVASVHHGARMVEKHITWSHHYSKFRDHQHSAEPHELREMVRRIRAAEEML